jgi:hypothetical protein
MKEIVIETLLDAVKLLPFLFITFVILEYIEHKFSDKTKNKISKAGKFGPVIGSLLGALPQCGFSVMATNLYATRVITLGTLISIYLSTSDEMLPLLISNGTSIKIIVLILITKIVIGILSGIIIDFIIRKNDKADKEYEIKNFCLEEHCHCEHSLLKSILKHTFSILIFIIIVSFILNLGIDYLGKDNIGKIFFKNTFFSPFISSLVGLIPNCASSVIITELYMNDVISLASCISGLLTGSGVALLVLFKANKSFKENIKIILTLYLIGSLSGIVIELIQMFL